MSKYTTEVRFICETNSGLSESVGYDNVELVIANSRSKIFNFSYPIYDETYRSVLETKILKHFYTREIGAETVGLWKLWLDTRLNEIMPYYNELYKSTLLEYNPLIDIDLTTTRNGTVDGTKNDKDNTNNSGSSEVANTGTVTNGGTVSDTGTITDSGTTGNTRTDKGTNGNTRTDIGTDGNTRTDIGTNGNTRTDTGNSEHWNYYSDTPQGGINGMSLDSNTYLTNATHDTDTHSNTVIDSGNHDNTVTDSGNHNNTVTDSGNYDNTITDNGTNTNTKTLNTTSTISNTETLNTKVNGSYSDTGEKTSTSTFNNTEQYIEHITGKHSGVSYSKLIEDFRNNIINVDMKIIHELDDLFLNLW